ncbi:DNA methyltransferase [Psychrilyobacter atlanticus]|uniref:DNA methyltransferase n=1 Tax=Psychrilyobacter atlanticus TaxID=271091 RepID=UPI00040BC3C9|nr:DNA methyltransferase [Psychrilyobacter atlanticus]
MSKKYEDIEWDFLNNRYKYTHDIHKYPAKLVPGIVEKLLERYQTKGMDTLFEPYVGSGTTLIEANIKGLNCIGTDLNPLARKISKVKTTYINIQELTKKIEKFDHELIKVELNINNLIVEYPKVTNIKYWFKKRNIKQLVPIKEWIDKIQNQDIKDLFEIAFSETLREVSMTRNNEFKRYRIPKEDIEHYRKEAFFLMLGNLTQMRDKLEEYLKVSNKDSKINIYNFDTVQNIPEDILKENSVDIVITSPPYGDSQSTVAYGQFSRFANDWLGHENSEKIDAMLMGGKRKKEEVYFDFPLLDDSLYKIKEQDSKRVREVMSFYSDYQKSISNVAKVIKPGGIVAYVVGNRTIKGQLLKTDEVTKHFFEKNGFEHLETIIRNISRKRLPGKVAPTGKKGNKVKTMHKEYIVVMKKI